MAVTDRPVFEDYHRTVNAFHGTRLEVAERLVTLQEGFRASENDYDWLGHGVYFWEYAPKRAWRWAEQYHKTDQIAVLGASIRLGHCLDLLDPENVSMLEKYHSRYVSELELIGELPPNNANAKKYRDCAVFNYACAEIEEATGVAIDTIRGVFVPSGDSAGRPWERSGLRREAHIQLCVRNPRCILGAWMVSRPR